MRRDLGVGLDGLYFWGGGRPVQMSKNQDLYGFVRYFVYISERNEFIGLNVTIDLINGPRRRLPAPIQVIATISISNISTNE